MALDSPISGYYYRLRISPSYASAISGRRGLMTIRPLSWVSRRSQVGSKYPENTSGPERKFPFFFQGIAWIDQSTFDVVRLRTDLLSPVPSVNLQNMTTELRFRSVRIHGFGAVLWLPSEVLIRTARSDSIFEEIHQYSGYRFFHAESKLLP